MSGLTPWTLGRASKGFASLARISESAALGHRRGGATMRMQGPPATPRRGRALEYALVIFTVAVIVALATWFVGREMAIGLAPDDGRSGQQATQGRH